jgi:hypothetical protein
MQDAGCRVEAVSPPPPETLSRIVLFFVWLEVLFFFFFFDFEGYPVLAGLGGGDLFFFFGCGDGVFELLRLGESGVW